MRKQTVVRRTRAICAMAAHILHYAEEADREASFGCVSNAQEALDLLIEWADDMRKTASKTVIEIGIPEHRIQP